MENGWAANRFGALMAVTESRLTTLASVGSGSGEGPPPFEPMQLSGAEVRSMIT